MGPDEVEAIVQPPPLELGEPQLRLAAAVRRVHQLYQGPSDVEGEERGGGGLAREEDGRAAVAGVGADLRAGEVDPAAHCPRRQHGSPAPRGSRAHLAAVPPPRRDRLGFDCRAVPRLDFAGKWSSSRRLAGAIAAGRWWVSSRVDGWWMRDPRVRGEEE